MINLLIWDGRPELQDADGESIGQNPADVVKITYIHTSIWATGQSDGGKQFLLHSWAVAVWAWDGTDRPCPHHCGDDQRLLRNKDILSISFMKDTWEKKQRLLDWRMKCIGDKRPCRNKLKKGMIQTAI